MPRSRITVGFHRFGIVSAAPFLVGAAVAAVLQWQNPTGPVTLPAGTLAYRFGDDLDDAAKRIITQQKNAGYKVAFDDTMIVGVPLRVVRYNNADWTKVQLPDGREIGIASTESNKVSDVARQFLLAERRANRFFTEKDRVRLEGVQVEFLCELQHAGSAADVCWFARDPLTTAPLQHKEREWTWALLGLAIGLAIYIVMRAIGWVIDGFASTRPVLLGLNSSAFDPSKNRLGCYSLTAISWRRGQQPEPVGPPRGVRSAAHAAGLVPGVAASTILVLAYPKLWL
jgi:hypothetical protein